MRKMFLPKNKRGEGSDDSGGGAANSVTTKIEIINGGGISCEGNERATSVSNNGPIRYK